VLSGILFLFSCGISVVIFFALRTQLDEHAIEELETVEGFLRSRPDGTIFLESIDHDHPTPPTAQERFLEVRAESGEVLFRNELLGQRELDGPPTPEEGVGVYSERSLRMADGTRVRLISRRHPVDGRPVLIRLGFNEEMLWNRFFRVAAGLFLGLPSALALAGLGGHFLARRVLEPIARMAQRVREINAEQLNARLDVENAEDELGQLAQALNDTLTRLENSFTQLHRFTSDAAHELRTPLTALRSVGEVGLQRQGEPEIYREVISSMLEETSRLSRLVEDLLTLARADAKRLRLEPVAIPVVEFATDVASLLGVLAEEKNQTVVVEGNQEISVLADKAVLRQVMINLLDNAIKYSPEGGRITVRASLDSGTTAVIEVKDSGPGISKEHQQKIFDRFYRVDSARARETGGSGLGLAIAKWGVTVNGGKLELESRVGMGSIFRVLLPANLNIASGTVQ